MYVCVCIGLYLYINNECAQYTHILCKQKKTFLSTNTCVCVCACVRACVRACVHACVCECERERKYIYTFCTYNTALGLSECQRGSKDH